MSHRANLSWVRYLIRVLRVGSTTCPEEGDLSSSARSFCSRLGLFCSWLRRSDENIWLHLTAATVSDIKHILGNRLYELFYIPFCPNCPQGWKTKAQVLCKPNTQTRSRSALQTAHHQSLCRVERFDGSRDEGLLKLLFLWCLNELQCFSGSTVCDLVTF